MASTDLFEKILDRKGGSSIACTTVIDQKVREEFYCVYASIDSTHETNKRKMEFFGVLVGAMGTRFPDSFMFHKCETLVERRQDIITEFSKPQTLFIEGYLMFFNL